MIIPRTPYNQKYLPTKETIKFFVWLTSMIKEENKPASAHFQMIDHINRRNRYKLVECSRGLSKSTLIGIYSTLYWVWRGAKGGIGEIDYILYIMESVSNVATNIEQIAMIIDETPQLQEVLEVKKLKLGDDPTIYIYNKSLNKNFYIKGRGSGQAMRGTRIGGKRPNIIILDDIESEKTIATPELREKLKAWFYGAVLPAVNPNRYEIIMIGTPLHEDSLLVNALESDTWACIQLPVAEEFPCKKENFVSAWEDRFTWEYVNNSFKLYKDNGKSQLWFQEHMLEIAPKEGLVFDMDRIRWYKQSDMRDKLSTLTYYISVDLAISEKQTADFTSLAVVGIDPEYGDWFIVDGIHGRFDVHTTLNHLFRLVQMYKPYTVAIEGVAFQLAMSQIVKSEMVRRGTFFSIETVKRTSDTNKIGVIKALQPLVELGKFWVPEDYAQSFVKELIKEMSMTTQDKVRSKHDDLVDSVAMLTLIELLPVSPVKEFGNSELDFSSEIKNSYIF